MNNSTFAGRLGRPAETRYTQDGKPVTGFSLAVDEYAGKGERRTLWVDCSLWGERGEKLAEYLLKGSPVTVAGQVGIRTYETQGGETKAVLTLNVREITLQGSGQAGDQQQPRQGESQRGSQQQASKPAPQRQAPPSSGFPDDDIPF